MSEPQPPPPLPIGAGDEEGPPPGREPWLRFAFFFGSFAVASEIAYYLVALDSPAFESYLAVLARISGWVLELFGSEVEVSGTHIVGDAFAVSVAQGCDAIQVCSLLAAAVVAFPLSWRARFRGLVAGIALLQFLNILRIVTLYWIGGIFSDFFKTAHEMVWPSILIVATITAWILWVRWETPMPSPTRDAA